MAGTFVCPECGVHVHSPEWDGGKSLVCGNVAAHRDGDQVGMTHAD